MMLYFAFRKTFSDVSKGMNVCFLCHSGSLLLVEERLSSSEH
jgi:hypothetical protein